LSESIQSVTNLLPTRQLHQPTSIKEQVGNNTDFTSVLKGAMDHVSKAEQESNRKTELLVQGEIDDLHDVMITAQKASITVETAVQIQQKVIDIYNEMMRMQV